LLVALGHQKRSRSPRSRHQAKKTARTQQVEKFRI
jgi:hypothetical protein